MTLKYSSIFRRRFKNVHDTSSKYAMIFQCYFRRIVQIFDSPKITFMTLPPESIKSFKFDSTHETSSQLGDTSTQLGDASTHLPTRQKCNYDPNGSPYVMLMIKIPSG